MGNEPQFRLEGRHFPRPDRSQPLNITIVVLLTGEKRQKRSWPRLKQYPASRGQHQITRDASTDRQASGMKTRFAFMAPAHKKPQPVGQWKQTFVSIVVGGAPDGGNGGREGSSAIA
jgi:hypothetical protein